MDTALIQEARDVLDTEVLINLIEDIQKNSNLKLGKAVQVALNQGIKSIPQIGHEAIDGAMKLVNCAIEMY